MNNTAEKISTPVLMLFSMPNVVVGFVITALSVVIPAFYAKYTAASLAVIGTTLFAIRVIEAGLDPLAGHLCDITKTRFGSRKPWMFVGCLIAPVAAYQLFTPPATAGGVYFFIWYQLLLLTCWTAIIIPYRAWAVELSRDYVQRSKIFTCLGVGYGIGATSFALFPFLPFLESSEMSPENLEWFAWILVVAFPVLITAAIILVPQGHSDSEKRGTIKGLLGAVISNRPLLWFLAAFMIGGIGQGIVLACFFFYMDAYLGLGHKFTLALLVIYLTAIAAMPAWFKLMKAIGKQYVWAVGWGGAAILGIAMGFVPKGEDGLVILLIIVGLYGICSSVEAFAPYSLLGDVIDYDTLKTGVNRAGNYNAIAVFGNKFNLAVGGGIGFFLLDLFAYDVSGGANTQAAEIGFLFTYIVLPAVLYGISFFLIWRFPLSRKRHDIVRRRLEQLDSRATSI